jgi:RimJ/RimL family protein N-acetyltransferase
MIMQVECLEPKGPVIRTIEPMVFTEQNLARLWEKVQEHRVLMNDEINGDFKKFVEVFISMDHNVPKANGLVWVIDDFVGVFYMTHITAVDALVHYSFFDGRHRGRAFLTRCILKYAFDTYKFQRLSTQVACYAKPFVFEFIEKHIGFKREGRRRKCIRYKDQWFDTVHYGILKSEVDQWGLQLKPLAEVQRHHSQMTSLTSSNLV